jgi:hypothetical protein
LRVAAPILEPPKVICVGFESERTERRFQLGLVLICELRHAREPVGIPQPSTRNATRWARVRHEARIVFKDAAA